MARTRPTLPHEGETIFLAWTGTHTDLVFNHGLDLPGMAPFPLLETADGRAVLRDIITRQIDAARTAGIGALLDTPTFKASWARAPEKYRDVRRLAEANARAVSFLSEVREAYSDVPILISGLVGPSGDAYAPEDQTAEDIAEETHAAQIVALASAGVDLIGAYTFTHASDAVGAVRAAERAGVPIAISFTVETDGRLPLGQTLHDVIAEVDARTDAAPAYYMVNCAHPDHLAATLAAGDCGGRLKGLVVNASRKSHAELGRATALDAGDPVELGKQMGAICRQLPGLRVVGGCCGTDARHLSQMADACSKNIAAQ